MTILRTKPHGSGTLVTARSGLSGNESDRVLSIGEGDLLAGLERHAAGELIQNVFPALSTDDREFLITGITPEEWDNAFA